MANISKEITEKAKNLLIEKKQNLTRELSSFATKDSKLKDDWDSKYPRVPEGSLEEAAEEVEEYSTALPIEHSLELQLRDVGKALTRIENGSYGTCENCKKEISKERVFASPEATTCEQCLSLESKQ